MNTLAKVHYELTLLGDGVQALGLAMSALNMPGNSVTKKHAQCLGHLVEACGILASRLATDLEHLQEGDHENRTGD